MRKKLKSKESLVVWQTAGAERCLTEVMISQSKQDHRHHSTANIWTFISFSMDVCVILYSTVRINVKLNVFVYSVPLFVFRCQSV